LAVSAVEVYIVARIADIDAAWDDADKLTVLANQIRDVQGQIYRRLLDRIDSRTAELRGPAKLPRPSRQTDKQRRISACPRCGSRETTVA
jgi:hypothetical protein